LLDGRGLPAERAAAASWVTVGYQKDYYQKDCYQKEINALWYATTAHRRIETRRSMPSAALTGNARHETVVGTGISWYPQHGGKLATKKRSRRFRRLKG
jgi:hypothetical protein